MGLLRECLLTKALLPLCRTYYELKNENFPARIGIGNKRDSGMIVDYKALIPNKLFGTPLFGSWECELMVSGEEEILSCDLPS